MKKNYAFALLLVATTGSLAFMNSTDYTKEQSAYKNSHLAALNGSGAPTGRTGAPGESTCTDCHSGAAQNGTGINQVVFTDQSFNVVTSYVPGQTYNVGVTFTDPTSKNGFQIVALKTDDSQAGAMAVIPGTGVQVLTGSAGKKYVTHTTSGNSMTQWGFQWTAPATNVGDVTFYLATNKTNANGNTTGDVIRTSEHMIGSVVGVDEKAAKMELSVGYNSNLNSLTVNYTALSAGSSSLNLTDISGKSVFFEGVGETAIGENKKSVKLPSDLKAGIYIVHLNVNNSFASKKIYIQD
jgi:hypothetical protein